MADFAIQPPERLNTVEEAAARLRICRAMGYRLIKSGQLRTVKIGRRRLVPDSAIVEFIAGLSA